MGTIKLTLKDWTEVVNERDALRLTKKFCVHILECIRDGKPSVNASDTELRRYDKQLAFEALKKLDIGIE